jgi:GNAT superfamily N-acetyltransferase
VTGEYNKIGIRLLRQCDLGGAVDLAREELWNQTEDDWRRLLSLSPMGCFGAFLQGMLLGTVTTIAYSRDVGWLGMMLVRREARGRGIGGRLVRTALGYLTDIGIQAVKLDATPAGKPLYESLGFSTEATIERWEGIAESDSHIGSGSSGLEPSTLQQIYELDLRAFGADRGELLGYLIRDACCPAATASGAPGSSPLSGYALARRGDRATYVGPIVAEDQDTAAALLAALLVNHQGQRVFLDRLIHAGTEDCLLIGRGWVKQRSLTRMVRGRLSKIGISRLNFAIAGPELG